MKSAHPESQRDSIIQPRVARHELPWVNREKNFQPQRGCINIAPNRCNPFRVDSSSHCVPRVARPSQPWAERHYPFRVNPRRSLPVECILAAKQSAKSTNRFTPSTA